MKFGKELSSQMIPEWHEAYMDYHFLKTIIKDIHIFKQSRNKESTPPQGLIRNLTLYRAFSGLTLRHHHHHHHHGHNPISPTNDVENPVIVINSVTKSDEGMRESCYETRFLMEEEDGGEYELVYFRRLDDEFNKVDRFYRGKVEEVVEEAEVLNVQMDALIAFRVKVVDPEGSFDSAAEMTRLASGVAASAAALAASTPAVARAASRRAHMTIIEEDGSSSRGHTDEPGDDDNIEMKIIHKRVEEDKPKNNNRAHRPAPLEILDRVKFNHTLETPRSTIKNFLNVPKNKELKFSKENLRKVEEQLKRAFVEFYHKLRLLKSYSFLNMLAFSKIMKKYDKVAERNASKSYLDMVDNSYLGSSDEVTKLMERVEAAFIKHFSNANRSKGMNILRPKKKREKHRETFSLGFFAGCAIALILALVLIIRARNLLEHKGKDKYMTTLFPLYSLFAFVVLHMVMYAANIYFWRKYRVNYSFIFGFKQGTELGYRQVLLAAFGLAVLALASVISNLDMEMDPMTHDYKSITELLPLIVLLIVIATLLCPLNIIYRSSRYFFLTCLFHSICAPLYKVTLPDFLVADQLTSQVQAIRSFQFYICYYGSGDYKVRENSCKQNDVFNTFLFIVAIIPYWCRLFQCLRRLYEEKDVWQGYNGLKYFSTIVAVCMRTAYSLNKSTTWNIIAWISSAISAIVCTYWDLVLDWGLLQRRSKNRWLRDKLLVPYKSVYFGAMVLNVLLRFAWLQTVLNIRIDFLHKETVTTIMASLEIIRRGIWNFFRLENEHLNNVGKYRAFKSVPLPFNYDEDDEDKED